MTQQTQTFVVADPRTFDGNPYDVAEKACAQSAAIAKILTQSLPNLRLMVRNAQLERDIALGGAPDALAWEDGPQARTIEKITDWAEQAEQYLALLGEAAKYDPKAPAKA